MITNENFIKLTQALRNQDVYEISHSPVYELKGFGNNDHRCFIKRDDLIGGLCNGSKQRKFLSVIPYLLKQKFTEVIVVGGAYSNNVTALVPLLIQNDIKPILFLRGDPSTALTGNFLHTRVFVPEDNIHWFNREQWPFVMRQAGDYLNNAAYQYVGIIPEGACMPEALWGSLTLSLDLITNEQQMSVQFDHIFIEAGTGGTVAALIIGLALLKRHIPMHILLLTDNEQTFRSTLILFQQYCERQLRILIDLEPIMQNVFFHRPRHYKSFGAVGSHLFHDIIKQARANGILLDPIYAAKLVMTGRDIIQHCSLTGNILFVHNGGTLSIMGYQQQMEKALLIHENYAY